MTDSGHDITEQVAYLIETIGTDLFAPALLVFLRRISGADHLSIFGFGDKITPTLLQAESAQLPALAPVAGRHYLRSLAFRHDPLFIQSKNHPDDYMMIRLRLEEIEDDAYRQDIFERFQLQDRLSILGKLSFGWAAINIYRSVDSGEFDPADVIRLQQQVPLLRALVSKHGQISGVNPQGMETTGYFEHLLAEVGEGLSPREIQVCSRALHGKTSVLIAEDLGIQTNTVNTLKKRAYAKLGISSLPQLFALCLSVKKREP